MQLCSCSYSHATTPAVLSSFALHTWARVESSHQRSLLLTFKASGPVQLPCLRLHGVVQMCLIFVINPACDNHIVFLQTPGPTSAKRLFRASLLFLPLFMLGMAVHRIPQTQEHQSLQQVMTQTRLNLPLRAHSHAPEERLDAPSRGAFLTAFTAAPFPFLPVPLRCPSKVACEAGPDAEEASDEISN